MKNNFLSFVARLCIHSGSNFICRPIYGGLGLILVFHRFTNEPHRTVDNGGVISSQFLDRLLGYIQSDGPKIIRLDDVPKAIEEGKQFVCLTFDDGYRDNKEVALPVLRRHNAPATIFVPSRVLDRSLDSWWLQIEELAKTKSDPRATYTDMVAEASRDQNTLDRMRSIFIFDQFELNEHYFMSIDDVKEIDQDPLIDIGGHTLSHPLLKNLDEDVAYQEIKQNKTDLEELLQRPVETFAYPYGNSQACGSREFELAQKAGYKVAVTTRDGNVFPAHRNHLTALPRYSVRGFLENLAVYEMQKSGIYRILKSRFGPAFVTE